MLFDYTIWTLYHTQVEVRMINKEYIFKDIFTNRPTGNMDGAAVADGAELLLPVEINKGPKHE